VRRSVGMLFKILVIGAGGYLILMYMDLRPIKDIGDFSPELTQIAKAALPIINQATLFFSKNGHYPGDHELRDLVKDPRRNHEGDNMLGSEIAVPGYSRNLRSIVWNYCPDQNMDSYALVCRVSLYQYLRYGWIKKGAPGMFGMAML
jgi:hypothetical protein